MVRQGANIAQTLVFIILIPLASAIASTTSDLSIRFDRVKQLLVQAQYSEAETEAILLHELALQHNDVSADGFLALGRLFQDASRFEVAKVMLSTALEDYTRQGELDKMTLPLLYLAIAERHLGNYSSALSFIQRGMSIAQVAQDQSAIAQLNIELGIVKQEMGEIEDALSVFMQALKFFREGNDKYQTSVCLLHIGDTYLMIDNYSLAHTYYQDAIEIIEQVPLGQGLSGKLYSRLGELHFNNNDIKNAMTSLEKSMTLLRQGDDKEALAETQILLAKVLVKNGDLEKGREILQEAIAFAIDSAQDKLIKEGRLALAHAYLQEHDYEQALIHARQGTVEARTQKDLRGQLSFLTVQLSTFVSLGDFEKALDIQSVIQQLREALLDTQNKAALEGLQAEIELVRQSHKFEKLEESKRLALAEAEREKLQSTLFWSMSLAILLVLFLVWSRYKQRQQTVLLRSEVKRQTLSLQEKNDELERAYRTLEEVSLRDPLTGLYNRQYLESQLPAEIKRSQFAANHGNDRTDNKTDLLCLLIDIDFFKKINDTYGHIAGDKVLTGFAQVLKEAFRPSDLIIRWGGEEFLVVCRYANREELPELAERCRDLVANTLFDVNLTSPISLTCSIGFSLLPPTHTEEFDTAWSQTFAVVDYALYAAKLSGRNGWVGVVETYDQERSQRLPIDTKFGFAASRLATSFNNIASIKWPDSLEE
ncbi:hypothetical protein D210916BOD24_06210 [Alteromonas sp. D210916BOD_24]|uniref:diguanylate cyclase n=1 Tax=Alteromonas sp. D210916BOD_24 TaxID=3157618 RepID=UPI00399D085F